MNPHLHGICEGSLDARTASTLTILARSIQKMANLSTFSRDREPHLHLINDFIKTNSKNLALFVERLLADNSREKQEKQTINVSRDAASLVQYFNTHQETLKKYDKEVPQVKQLLAILKKINNETNYVKQQMKNLSSTSTTSIDDNHISPV